MNLDVKKLLILVIFFSSIFGFSQKNTIIFNQNSFENGTFFYNVKYSFSRKLDNLQSTKLGYKIIYFKGYNSNTIEYTNIYHNFDTILSMESILYSSVNNSYNLIRFGFNRLYVIKCSKDTINQIFDKIKKSEYVKEKIRVKKLRNNSNGLTKLELKNLKKDFLNKMLLKIHLALNDSIVPNGYEYNLIKQDNENVLLYYSLYNFEDFEDNENLYLTGNSVAFELLLKNKTLEELIKLAEKYMEVDKYAKAAIIYKIIYLKSGNVSFLYDYKFLFEDLNSSQ
jgi:hypothetical protein